VKLARLDLARRTYRDLGLKFVWKMIGSWRLMCVKGFEMKLSTHLQPTFEVLAMIDFANRYEIQSPNISW
jgi:hypothetical protein